MVNLTLSIEDEVLKRARVKAIEEGTSVNAVVREQLRAYAGADDQREARRRIIDHASRSVAGSGAGGRAWTREQIYEKRVPKRLREESQPS